MNNSKKGAGTDFIQKEIVIQEPGNKMPLIWVQDFKTEYYTYETIRIPFKALDPNNNGAFITLYKNGVQVGTRELDSSQVREWQYWEITNLTVDDSSYYTIKVGTDPYSYSRNFNFTILIDPLRDMKLAKKDNLKVNFIATGRSNSESKAKRQTWSYTLDNEVKTATFTDFNWYNNGWMMDKEINQTCLRISNGAQLSIPYKSMTFASNNLDNQSHTVELQFRIRNIQNYDNLIKNITRYKIGEGDDAPTDDTYYEEFKAQKDTGYDNYDAFLQWRLPPEDYEKLAIWKVETVIQIDNVVAGLYDYYNNTAIGFCIGTQDAFFSNGSDTVNVNFVENDLINLNIL